MRWYCIDIVFYLYYLLVLICYCIGTVYWYWLYWHCALVLVNYLLVLFDILLFGIIFDILFGTFFTIRIDVVLYCCSILLLILHWCCAMYCNILYGVDIVLCIVYGIVYCIGVLCWCWYCITFYRIVLVLCICILLCWYLLFGMVFGTGTVLWIVLVLVMVLCI